MPRDKYYLPTRRLVSQDEAAMIERSNVPRSKFIGSHSHKTAFNAGLLIPFLVDEVLPGDHLTYNVTAYIRMATPLFPILDNQRVDTFLFYVPCRLLWDNWTKFMGEQDDPLDTTAYAIPNLELAVGNVTLGSIYDYMGIPGTNQLTANIEVNALPLRAYNLIFNQWFRDQNLQNSIAINKDNGPDAVTDYNIEERAKSHDYFTSALPWPQKFTAPTIPLGGLAPVSGIGFIEDQVAGVTSGAVINETNAIGVNYPFYMNDTVSPAGIYIKADGGAGNTDNRPQIFADLAAVSGVAINVFRQAFLVQSLLERDARGGTRYVELIRSHFGVTNPDFRLQRPEYIGGGQTPLQITPIAQTAPTAEMPLGALGAAGTAAGSHRASYAATEHGYIIGLINVRSELSYQQGLHKLWRRATRYDFYWPALAQLGEQAIVREEIFATGVDADDAAVFGYQERWHEYRTNTSRVSGIMRSTAPGTIDPWHLAQNFITPPVLNSAFIKDTPPMIRILAAGEEADKQQYLADILISRVAVRPIPAFGTPALLGRF